MPSTPPSESPTLVPASGATTLAALDANCIPGYEILSTLGRGGMGVVYQARQKKAGPHFVALEMILAGSHAGASDLARFQTEAEAIARLQHPNIVQVFEVGEHEGKPFFSLEFCSAGSLEKQLDGTPLPAGAAATLVESLARAMLSRTSSTSFIATSSRRMYCSPTDGTPKITDFGLAKKLDQASQTQSGAIMGTPSYMAPEQAGSKSGEIGPTADVYALGAILYECLSGRPPFRAATALDTILQVVSDEPVPPSRLQSKTPRDLETICLKCLQKNSTKRYATAAALAEDLGRFQRGEPVLARPVGSLERSWRWCRRNPMVAVLSAAAAGLLLAGTIVSTIFGFQAAQEAEKSLQAQTKAQAGENAARHAEAQATRRAYGSGMLLTQSAWEQNHVDRFLQLLKDQNSARVGEEDLRGFEWHYWTRQFQRGYVTLKGHTDAVSSVSFSPDGKHVASASLDKTCKALGRADRQGNAYP